MKLLLYCTKAKPYLFESYITKGKYMLENNEWFKELNGKIVAECDFEVEEIEYSLIAINNNPYLYYELQNTFVDKFYEKSCLNHKQVEEYLGFNNGYAIHIKNLHIFDKPKELNEVCKYDFWASEMFGINATSKDLYVPITKAPQNMMRVWLYENGEWVMYILISIQPQWMCKILNKEKTVEVRRVVLKEMLKCLN